MKKIIYILLIITTPLFSQTQNNFEVETDGNIIYKNIFELGDSNKENLLNYLKTLSNITISESENDIVGEIKDLRINTKKYGNGSGFPIFLRESLSSDFLIQFKDNRYRVILKNIGFLDDVSLYSQTTFKDSDNFTYLTEFYVKNDGTLRSGKMVEKTLDVMNNHFTDLFTYKVVIDNDW